MTHLCAAVIQTRSGRDIARNIEETSALIRAAARDGALLARLGMTAQARDIH